MDQYKWNMELHNWFMERHEWMMQLKNTFAAPYFMFDLWNSTIKHGVSLIIMEFHG